jgi:hypothetical protein
MNKTAEPADIAARACAILEEELGEFRPFADLPASEIEAMAARLVRALTPVLAGATVMEERRTAA